MLENISLFTLDDLNNIDKSGIIRNNVKISGEYIMMLKGIKKIVGYFYLCDSAITSLGELEEIEDNFWITTFYTSPKLKTLGKLERVGGDLKLRYSSINDLGDLKYIGGDLNIRDTNIQNLGKLEFVGGNLLLPKRLQNNLNLSKVTINGKVKYFKDVEFVLTKKKTKNRGLVKFHGEIPFYHNIIFEDSIGSDGLNMNLFYKNFKKNFLKGRYIDLKDNKQYLFPLQDEFIEEFKLTQDYNKFIKLFGKINKYYGEGSVKPSEHTIDIIISVLEENERYEEAWKFISKKKNIELYTIYKYERALNKNLFNWYLYKEARYLLEEFGINNSTVLRECIRETLTKLRKETGKDFFKQFFDDGEHFKPPKPITSKDIGRKHKYMVYTINKHLTYDLLYYKKFYDEEDEGNFFFYLKCDVDKLDSQKVVPEVIDNALRLQFYNLRKDIGNLFREKIGLPKIGEGWISETTLYYQIKNAFPEKKVKQHYTSIWLGQQHLDIYLPSENIGVEYQGEQHFTPIDYFGGAEAFKNQIERDERKKEKCIKNNCHLICVREVYVLDDVLLEIKNQIEINSRSSKSRRSRNIKP